MEREKNEYIITTKQLDWYNMHLNAYTFMPKFCERLEPIVRCRDCKHYTDDEVEYKHYCNEWCGQVKPDGFCAWGNRVEFVTCKCGEDIEAVGEIQVCPSCGRKVWT